MSFGCDTSDFIAMLALSTKVHTAYRDAGDDYSHTLEELVVLQILINEAAKHFKSTTISSEDHLYGQKVLKGCQIVLADLNSLFEKYKRLASINKRLMLIRLKEDIETLQVRLISNTGLLKGFVRRFVIPGILLSPMDTNIPILVVNIERPKNSWLLFLVFTTQVRGFQLHPSLPFQPTTTQTLKQPTSSSAKTSIKLGLQKTR